MHGATAMTAAIGITVDADGIAIATMDHPGRSMNVLDEERAQALDVLIGRIETDTSIRGVILVSAKADFLAGADIDRLRALETAQEAFDASMQFKAALRRMER